MANHLLSIVPEKIEQTSFAIIDSEVLEPRPFTGNKWAIVRRMIHTTADFELLSLVRFHADAVKQGVAALLSGCLIVTDTEMACRGITSARMDQLGCRVRCFMGAPEVAEAAMRENTTRAAAAVDHVLKDLDGAIYVVGNAPTALIRLLRQIVKNACHPALISGMPVGFVNAAESKALLENQQRIPFVTIRGRKGGSALAASVVNQLGDLALARKAT